jgi:protein-S-isoprenylcysteine O-methyltransferase Ste14
MLKLRPLHYTVVVQMIRIFGRLFADTVLIAVLLFATAGTFSWWRAWVLLAVLLLVRTATAIVIYRVNPALMQERARLPIHSGQPVTDKVLLLLVLGTGFVLLPVIVSLDVFRWHLLPAPPHVVSAMGLLLFTLGWVIKALALHANAFAATTVRLQSERRHVVVDQGVYRIVRHPFYAGTPLVMLGMCLWLESPAATLCVSVPMVFIVARLILEERFLLRELPDYAAYAQRVQHRLYPGVW